MADEIMKELWAVKDAIAREHDYNVDALAAHFRARPRVEGEVVVDLSATQKAKVGASDTEKM